MKVIVFCKEHDGTEVARNYKVKVIGFCKENDGTEVAGMEQVRISCWKSRNCLIIGIYHALLIRMCGFIKMVDGAQTTINFSYFNKCSRYFINICLC